MRKARRRGCAGEQGPGARVEGYPRADQVLPVDGAGLGQAGVRGGPRVRGQVRGSDG